MCMSLKYRRPSRGSRGHSEVQGGEPGHRPWLPKPAPFPSPSHPGRDRLSHRPGAPVSKGQLGQGATERLPNRGLPPGHGVLLVEF